MPKNDNAHAQRLAAAIKTVDGGSAATKFADEYPLSGSADVLKKARWACEICTALQRQYGEDRAAAIRRACRCGDGKTMAREIAECIHKAGSLAQGCILFSQKNKYAFLQYVSEQELVFGYHSCVCSCIKRAEGTVPILWCECSAGYAESMFRSVFGESVHVILLESAKSGGSCCRMKITWQ